MESYIYLNEVAAVHIVGNNTSFLEGRQSDFFRDFLHLKRMQSRMSVRNAFKMKSHEISFAHKLLLSCQIVLKFCAQLGYITAVYKLDFVRFEYRTKYKTRYIRLMKICC